MSTINVNALDKESGSTLTLGGSGTTVAVHASATTSGFDSGLASVQTFTSSGTWTKPSGITKIIVEVQAGGAGGGGSSSTSYGSGSGGGGGYAREFLDVSSISTATITVGSGGTGGTSSSTGVNGGLSSWVDGTNTLTANGGNGGVGNSGSTYTYGGAGGTASGGDLNITGGSGKKPVYETPSGGGSFFASPTYSLTGSPANATGYGGGGCGTKATVTSGGDGSSGIVIVTEYK